MKGKVRIGLLGMMMVLLVFRFSEGGQPPKKTADSEAMSKAMPTFGFSSSSRSPIDVTSDSVEANQRQNTVTFKGNVIVKQEDISLYANTIVVYYNPDTKKLKQIVASGNVRVIQLDRRATGQKAIFQQEENKVTLEGEAVLREGDNVIRGERVVYYVDEGRSVVESGKGGRVSTTIVPSQKEESEAEKGKK